MMGAKLMNSPLRLQFLTLGLLVILVQGRIPAGSLPKDLRSSRALHTRGGGSSHQVGSGDRNDFPDLVQTATSLSASATNLVVSGYMVAQEVTRQQIIPTLQNPHQKLWRPARSFIQEQQAKAVERRRLEQEQHEKDLKSTPIKRTVAPNTEHRSNTLRKSATSSSEASQTQRLSGLGIILLPSRIFKLSLGAWVMAEVLDRIGILHEDTPALMRSQFHRVWYDVQPFLSKAQTRLSQVWGRCTPSNLRNVATKYQFAIGAGIGMIFSPLVLTVTAIAWQPALLLYGLSELNELAKESGRGLETWLGQNRLEQSIDRGLSKIRQSVRIILPDQGQHYSQQALLGGTTGGSKQPYTLGMVAYCSPPVSKKKVPAHMRLVASRTSNPQDGTVTGAQSSDPFQEMVRHGALVGGALAFLLGA